MSEDLELNDAQAAAVRFVERAIGHGKHAGRSAVRHLEKAWRIRAIDPQMAAFRGITAEEEAATAIFLSLKRCKYEGAERLLHRDHSHKAAVWPFFLVIADCLRRGGFKSAQSVFDERGPNPTITTRVRVPWPDGEDRWVSPIPPLHFSVTVNGRHHDFSEEITALCSRLNSDSILKYIKDRANRRNRLLYASPNGVPEWAGDIDAFLRTTRDIVFAMLTVFLLIDQTSEHQSFVQQALGAFLRMLNTLPPGLDRLFE